MALSYEEAVRWYDAGTIKIENGTLTRVEILVAAQGSWSWQQRLRAVQYYPVRRKRDNRLVWGNPVQLDGKISGGNLRGSHYYGVQSPIWEPLTAEECLCMYAYGLQ